MEITCMKCINCQHFRQGSLGLTKPEQIWGGCLRVKEHAQSAKDKAVCVGFKWADGSCEHFEPKETSDDSPGPDSQ